MRCPSCRWTPCRCADASREPCAYCGARPTWRVEYHYRAAPDVPAEEPFALYLCAACDEQEAREWTEEDTL